MAIELATNQSTAAAKKPAEQAQVWLNIGYDVTDPVTGEVAFVSLPLGTPIDTMQPKALTGSSEGWHQLVDAKNDLLETLKTLGASLKPGQEETVVGLTVQIRRVNAQVAPAKDSNPMRTGLAAIGFAKAS